MPVYIFLIPNASTDSIAKITKSKIAQKNVNVGDSNRTEIWEHC